MPQTPGGGTGGDPTQAQNLVRALRQAGYNVTLDWVTRQMEAGLTAQQIVARAQRQFGGDGGGGGGAPSLEDILGDAGIGGGGSGGSSGGGGGSSGPSAEDLAKQRRMLRANYSEILRRWGLSPNDGGLGNLIDHAVGAEWSTTEFMQAIRRTKAYKRQFAGIRWREGMTEGEYIRLYGRARETAKDFGRGLSRQQFGIMLKKGIELNEFEVRLKFFERVQRSPGLKAAVEATLRASGGLGPKEKFTIGDLYRLATRKGDPRWERIIEESVVRQGFQSAGLTIGRKGDFTRKEMLRLINQVEGGGAGDVEALTLQDFQKLATTIQEVMPLSQLYGMGVTKHDLAVLSLGGRGADKIAQRVDEILATRNLQNEAPAQPQLQQKQGGGTTLGYGGLSGEEGE